MKEEIKLFTFLQVQSLLFDQRNNIIDQVRREFNAQGSDLEFSSLGALKIANDAIFKADLPKDFEILKKYL